jgi:8-oxo-dGTP diphosphatase
MKATEQGLQGDKKQRYQVVPRTLIFLTSANPQGKGLDVLLIKGSPTKRLWANKFNGIGGHVEWHEDIHAAAQRELAEETGLTGIDLKLRGVLNIAVQPGGETPAGVVVFLFCGETTERAVQIGVEGEPDWVPLTALQEYPLVDDLYELLPRLFTDDASVYGHYFPQPDGTMSYQFNR